MNIELTARGHKRKLGRLRERHVAVPDAIMHDCKAHLISKHNLSDIECIGASMSKKWPYGSREGAS